MKKEVVKANEWYVARYKRWYHIQWRYIGIVHTHGRSCTSRIFVRCETKEDAINRLNDWFPTITTID